MAQKVNPQICKPSRPAGMTGAVYGLGFLGALVYVLQHATTFWIGTLGVLKAIVWPAILVYKAAELLKL